MDIVGRGCLPNKSIGWPTEVRGKSCLNLDEAGWVNKFLHQVTAAEGVPWQIAKRDLTGLGFSRVRPGRESYTGWGMTTQFSIAPYTLMMMVLL